MSISKTIEELARLLGTRHILGYSSLTDDEKLEAIKHDVEIVMRSLKKYQKQKGL